MPNAHSKLRGGLSNTQAAARASITRRDLVTVVDEIAFGTPINRAVQDRPVALDFLRTLRSISSTSSWTDYNKRPTRMCAISIMFQMGQPLIWVTVNPTDVSSPISMRFAGVPIEINDESKGVMPD